MFVTIKMRFFEGAYDRRADRQTARQTDSMTDCQTDGQTVKHVQISSVGRETMRL